MQIDHILYMPRLEQKYGYTIDAIIYRYDKGNSIIYINHKEKYYYLQ